MAIIEQAERGKVAKLLGVLAEFFAEEPKHAEDEKPKGYAASVAFITADKKVLLLKRSATEENWPNAWAFPGGKADAGEALDAAAKRECIEEIGECNLDGLKEYDRKRTPFGWEHATFIVNDSKEFKPKLNSEYSDYVWAPLDKLPEGMHPAVKATLDSMNNSVTFAHDHIPFAFDKDSLREFDKDGRLHVKLSNISKATVNPYLGKEIPGYEQLGLDANKVYKLLRDPKELEKATPTFNGLPLLIKHKPTTAIDHQTDLTVGSLGTDAIYEHPYLKNSLVIWPIDAIEGVEDGEQKELSAGYRYTPDMTPGVYEGDVYDGVMRNIVGNHVALVSDGRAGPDVVVGDEKNPLIEEIKTVKLQSRLALTAKGALLAYLAPRLAQDAKLDISSALADVNAKNFKTTKAGIVPAIQKLLTKGKLAQDASPEEMQKIIDLIDKEVDGEKLEDDAIPEAAPPPKDKDAKEGSDEENPEVAKIMAHLKEKHPEAHDSVMAMRQASDEPPEFPGKPKLDNKDKVPAQDEEDKDTDKAMVDKPAMDAAIKKSTDEAVARVKREQKEIRDAERAVAPYVGTLAVACDSAAEVYRHALKTLGMDAKEVDGLHESALPSFLKLHKPAKPAIAQDTSFTGEVKDFASRYPEAARIRVAR